MISVNGITDALTVYKGFCEFETRRQAVVKERKKIMVIENEKLMLIYIKNES